MTFRALALLSLAAATLVAASPAAAQTHPAYPARPITLVVPQAAGFAPAGVPPDVLATLQDATRKALDAKDLRDKLGQQGVEIAAPTTPAQFTRLLQDDLAKWARTVKASGAAVD